MAIRSWLVLVWDDDKGSNSGSVYVFVRSGTTWTQQQKLVANDGAARTSSAIPSHSMAIRSWLVLVMDDDKGSRQWKRLRVRSFGHDVDATTKTRRERRGVRMTVRRFVALDGDTLVVGARNDDDKGSNSGSVYVFVRSGTTWTQHQKLVANDGAAWTSSAIVALDGDTLVVGARNDDDNGSNSGSVYVFVRSGTTWTQQQKLVANDGASWTSSANPSHSMAIRSWLVL